MSTKPVVRVHPKPVDVRTILREGDRLYAVLDAARDHRVMDIVSRRRLNSACLIDLEKAPDLKFCAPYVVDLTGQWHVLEEVFRVGWGLSWGFLCLSREPIEAIRRHFKRFLNVLTEAGEVVYFRFYDPRVLRVFLRSCTNEEAKELFGPARCLWVEASGGETAMVFSLDSSGPQVQHKAFEGS